MQYIVYPIQFFENTGQEYNPVPPGAGGPEPGIKIGPGALLTSDLAIRTIDGMRRCLQLLLLFLVFLTELHAGDSTFDLSGPKVDVHVKRGNVTLPISEVPNLLPGDRIWVHPDLPPSQSTHFVLVIAFLRGATNPPPSNWFTRVETWNSHVRSEGVFVTVPKGAQQALLFLAPETGGDFNTLRKTVQGRPGAFVRAAQDLEAASRERTRLEAYLSDVKITSQTDPNLLKKHAQMAARSLGIKLNMDCFNKPSDQQATCLSQNSEGLVLDDSNQQSLVTQLTNGSAADLMNQLSYSTVAGGGMYSPYVGAIVDTVRILGSLHTAHFQYIPALALPQADTLNLRLNMPPSFRNPKSVVVVALPPLGPAVPDPLHPVAPSDTYCAQKPGLVLPAEGAPRVFASQVAHDLVLHIEPPIGSKSAPVDLPLEVHPSEGGLVLEQPAPLLPDGELTGVVRGKWGFDDWVGPRYHLHSSEPGHWALVNGDESALVVGRNDTLHFEGQNTTCVDKLEEETASDSPVKLVWKSPTPDTLTAVVPMKDAAPGPVRVSIYQYGMAKPEALAMKAYADAASLDLLTLNAGDDDARLKGTRLDEVATVKLRGITWTPAGLSRVENLDQLTMKASSATDSLKPGTQYVAEVQLLDGRRLKVPVSVKPPRPQITLLSKSVQLDASDSASPVRLGSPDDLPVTGRLVFFVKSIKPGRFPRNEKVEVAAADDSFSTVLSLSDGGLLLSDAQTAMGSVEPLARFGPSAFGPIHVRAVATDGVAGNWLPLGTLVRMPVFGQLRCPHSVSKPCFLKGSNLFLASSIAATPDFEDSSDVPPDFTGTELTVPHTANGTLYLKLRDDPNTVQTLTLPVSWIAQPLPPALAPSAQPAAAPPSATSPAMVPAGSGAPESAPGTAPGSTPGSAPATTPGTSPSNTPGAPSTAAPATQPATPQSAPAAPATTPATPPAAAPSTTPATPAAPASKPASGQAASTSTAAPATTSSQPSGSSPGKTAPAPPATAPTTAQPAPSNPAKSPSATTTAPPTSN